MTAASYLSRLVDRTLATTPSTVPRLLGLYEQGREARAAAHALAPAGDELKVDSTTRTTIGRDAATFAIPDAQQVQGRTLEPLAPVGPTTAPSSSPFPDVPAPPSGARPYPGRMTPSDSEAGVGHALRGDDMRTEATPSWQRPAEGVAPSPMPPTSRGDRSIPGAHLERAVHPVVDVTLSRTALSSSAAIPREARDENSPAAFAAPPDAALVPHPAKVASRVEAAERQDAARRQSFLPIVAVEGTARRGAPRAAGALIDAPPLFATPQARSAAIAAASALVARDGDADPVDIGPTVHVTIGRVELRLPAAAPPPSAARAVVGRPSPKLHDYLNSRDSSSRP